VEAANAIFEKAGKLNGSTTSARAQQTGNHASSEHSNYCDGNHDLNQREDGARKLAQLQLHQCPRQQNGLQGYKKDSKLALL
jgi:hypothetical protein